MRPGGGILRRRERGPDVGHLQFSERWEGSTSSSVPAAEQGAEAGVVAQEGVVAQDKSVGQSESFQSCR